MPVLMAWDEGPLCLDPVMDRKQVDIFGSCIHFYSSQHFPG